MCARSQLAAQPPLLCAPQPPVTGQGRGWAGWGAAVGLGGPGTARWDGQAGCAGPEEGGRQVRSGSREEGLERSPRGPGEDAREA